MFEALAGSNKEWLGLIIPLWAVLFFFSYLSVMPAIYEAEEHNFNPRVKKFIDAFFSYGDRLAVLFVLVIMPIILLGFTFGYFQSHTNDATTKVFGHVVGALNAILIFGIYRYYVPNS